MSLLLAARVMSGFSRTVNANLFHANRPRPWLLWVHGVVFSTWIVFFIAQSALVRARVVCVHRLLGWFGAGLATVNAMAIIGADRSWWRCLSSRQLKTLWLRYSPQHRVRRGTEVLLSARDVAVYRACLVEEVIRRDYERHE